MQSIETDQPAISPEPSLALRQWTQGGKLNDQYVRGHLSSVGSHTLHGCMNTKDPLCSIKKAMEGRVWVWGGSQGWELHGEWG